MLRLASILVAVVTCGLLQASCSSVVRAPASQPVGRWTWETRAVYELLGSLKGKGLLMGHQNATTEGHLWREVRAQPEAYRSDIHSVVGDFPAVYGWDLLDMGYPTLRGHILAAHRRGGINTISWHMPNPVTGGAYNDTTRALEKIQPGESHHPAFVQLMDRAADFLESLRDDEGKPIPILYRPFHEHNGNWFWWGLPHGNESLYVDTFRMFVDHLVNRRGLKSLIIVYSPDASGGGGSGFDPMRGYPGDDWVDVIGIDQYIDVGRYSAGNVREESLRKKVAAIVEMARVRGKLAAIAETGLEGVGNPNWWTDVFLKGLGGGMSDSLAYVMLWRNAQENPEHYYAPFPGHPSVPDFLKLKASGKVWFNEDLKKFREKQGQLNSRP